MKKLISIIMVMALVAIMSVAAFAEYTEPTNRDEAIKKIGDLFDDIFDNQFDKGFNWTVIWEEFTEAIRYIAWVMNDILGNWYTPAV